MSAYKIHEEAQEDLNTIWEYLAEQASPTIATSIEDEFFQAFALLSTQPGMGFQRFNLTSGPLRFWVMRGYLIVYAPERNPLLVLAVVHGRHHPRTIARILAERNGSRE